MLLKLVLSFVASVMVLAAMGAEETTDDCPKICPLHFAPLCGKNSQGELKTFSNSCEMKAKNCNGKNGKKKSKL
jgi:Kazal-type serine protease inhibitor domain